MTREETYAQMRKRLELNWNRREPTCGDALVRAINCLDSKGDINLNGIERDLIVYALAGELDDNREAMRQRAFRISPDDQFWLASMIAENVGYVLVLESHMTTSLEDRVSRLETAVRELNPGTAI